MYGSHVGTGGAAGTAALLGVQTASTVMLVLAVVMALITAVGIARRVARQGEHQRP